jgi:hypothetical protein
MRVFISYRRDDSADVTGRIFDRLRAHFDRQVVFRDVDNIPLGSDFREVIRAAVGGCRVLLAVIGPHWLDIESDGGLRRLDDPNDYLRLEVEAALARDIPVVPVLVGRAGMPPADRLPESLRPIAYKQGIEVRRDPDFHPDVDRLIKGLIALLPEPAPPQAQPPAAEVPTDRGVEYGIRLRDLRDRYDRLRRAGRWWSWVTPLVPLAAAAYALVWAADKLDPVVTGSVYEKPYYASVAALIVFGIPLLYVYLRRRARKRLALSLDELVRSTTGEFGPQLRVPPACNPDDPESVSRAIRQLDQKDRRAAEPRSVGRRILDFIRRLFPPL